MSIAMILESKDKEHIPVDEATIRMSIAMILESKDKEHIPVDEATIRMSICLNKLYVYTLAGTEEALVPVIVPTIDGQTLKKLVDWCYHHRHDPETRNDQPSTSKCFKLRTTVFREFDRDYFDMPMEKLKRLTYAASFLGVPMLYQLCLRHINVKFMGSKEDEDMDTSMKDVSNTSDELSFLSVSDMEVSEI
ncbi:unnamed protein product [Bursaphelenchus okinawaensis]|uniref:Skp1-related protein n=1 Tax=Bursaphelenchus okinawaensis TaxID=465554 RepID=A0A811KA84_9BILA|nr:unnamed protein product [Bursaphelenchus okinawaensis]CAG9099228.1 unnamed protein product [Bursaphelenchus okinawaensis]